MWAFYHFFDLHVNVDPDGLLNFSRASTTHTYENSRTLWRRDVNMRLRVAWSVWMALIPALALTAELPAGWTKAGSQPGEYDMGVDRTHRHENRAIGFVKGTASEFHGFGTLMQMAAPGEYRGKRVRLSAYVKSEKVQTGWAGLWFRVDGGDKTLGFDNMQQRPLKGTTDWKRVEIVLDVPEDATGLAYGLLLDGDGEAWMDDLKFEVVKLDVTVTGSLLPSGPPRNLNFEK
jgi:hypothetical protein